MFNITNNYLNTAPKVSFKASPQKTAVLAKQKIVNQLQKGKKPPEIAKMYKLSIRRIYDLMQEYKILPPQKAFHKNVEDTVIPLVKEGHSQKYISEKTGIKGGDIRKVCDRLGISQKEIRKQKFEELVKSGVSDTVIAEKLNMKISSVRSLRGTFLRKNDTEIKQKYDPWKLRRNKNSASLRNEFSKLIKAGKSVPQIAEKFKISVKTVYDYLKKMNLPHPQQQKAIVKESLAETVETLAKQGFSLTFIGKQTGLYGKKVKDILISRGIDFKAVRKARLDELFSSGASNEEIAKTMHKTAGSVKRARTINKTAPRNPFKERRIEYAIHRHNQGASVKQIADDLNVTGATIRNYLKAHKK